MILDAFEDAEAWQAIASGLAELKIRSKPVASGRALKLDFNFHGGGGFVVARRAIPLKLPETWEFRFRLRGNVPPNCFEFKLVDRAGSSVWRWMEEPLQVNGRWREFVISQSRLSFGWGPAGGGMPSEIGAVEFAISAGTGGSGSLLIDRLEWVDTGALKPVSCQTSSGDPRPLSDGIETTGWRSASEDPEPWAEFDFGRPRELGGMILHWLPQGARDVLVENLHDDGWHPLLDLKDVAGQRTPLPLPCPAVRRLRLKFGRGAGLRHIEWKGPEFSHSDDEFLHAIAAESRPGAFPKYWLRRQTLVTPVGSPSGGPRAMMNEEGLIETDEAGFSLEPFLLSGKKLWTWAETNPVQTLEKGWMPLPRVQWDCDDLKLDITARPTPAASPMRATIARYTIENTGSKTRTARLFVAVRPFQATPPWQHYGHLGGKSPITSIHIEDRICRINGTRTVEALDHPDAVCARPFASGLLIDELESALPPGAAGCHAKALDPLGLAEAVFAFDLTIEPGAKVTRSIAAPFGEVSGPVHVLPPTAEETRQEWAFLQAAAEFDVPPAWEDAVAAWRTAAAHILANREGDALHPGPRRYNRSWIRDGVVMGASLSRAGNPEAFRSFTQWYASFIRKDGMVPCCVDRNGPDWLAEFDSQGQWLYAITECHRFGSGDAFTEALWPTALAAIAKIRELRERRPDEGYDLPDKRPFRGLLPESASHEGYLAHPVHSYWDDFWAIRGLRDASILAESLGRPVRERTAIRSLARAMTEAVTHSLRATMELRKIPYVPGSVEWADFDPAATAVAVMLLDGLGVLPEDALQRTFDQYLEGFRKRVSGESSWTNYSAYEMRIVPALLRTGRRGDAIDLLASLLVDRRPAVWNQWPEITWRDADSPAHFGDLPHSWIGAEYVQAFASLFAYEREADDTLVIAAGLPNDWFANGRNNGVRDLRTWYGPLSYSLKRAKRRWELDFDALEREPRGGIEVRLPLGSGITELAVNGVGFAIDERGIAHFPVI